MIDAIESLQKAHAIGEAFEILTNIDADPMLIEATAKRIK